MPSSFQPQGRFVFNRSYVTQITVTDQSPNITMVDNVITTLIDPFTGYRIEYTLREEWLPWSSNRYTLDFCVYSCYWFGSYIDIAHVQDYGVAWLTHPTTFKSSIQIYNPFIRTDEVDFPLQVASVPYWLDGTDN